MIFKRLNGMARPQYFLKVYEDMDCAKKGEGNIFSYKYMTIRDDRMHEAEQMGKICSTWTEYEQETD